LSEAFNNSKEKESSEAKFKKIMNDFTVRARGTAAIPSSSQGNCISMSFQPVANNGNSWYQSLLRALVLFEYCI
jgi:hypothetical protein